MGCSILSKHHNDNLMEYFNPNKVKICLYFVILVQVQRSVFTLGTNVVIFINIKCGKILS